MYNKEIDKKKKLYGIYFNLILNKNIKKRKRYDYLFLSFEHNM